MKFEIQSLDDAKLADSNFTLSSLESQKMELEERIGKISSQFNIVIMNEKSLAHRVKLFMSKCVDLEKQLEDANSVSQAEVRQLKREVQFLTEKLANVERAFDELR